jgi:hypothetical protein
MKENKPKPKQSKPNKRKKKKINLTSESFKHAKDYWAYKRFKNRTC